MGMTARGLTRSAGWAFPLCSNRDGRARQRLFQCRWVVFVILAYLFLPCLPLLAQHDQHGQIPAPEASTSGHEHHGAAGDQAKWEGSVAGIAYSEFNHHLTGMLVLIIGLSELRQALAIP